MYLSLHAYNKPFRIIFLLRCPSLLYNVILRCVFRFPCIHMNKDLNILFNSGYDIKIKGFILPPVLQTPGHKAWFMYKSLLNIQRNNQVALEIVLRAKWDTARMFKYELNFHCSITADNNVWNMIGKNTYTMIPSWKNAFYKSNAELHHEYGLKYCS